MFGGQVKMGWRSGSVRLALALSVASAMAAGAMPASAQTSEARSFDIAAQPLQDAIILFARQSGVQITATGGVTSGRTASAVNGRMSVAQALSEMLSGSGLTWRWIDSRTVAMEPAPQTAEGTVQLGPVRVESAGQGGSRIVDATAASQTERSGSYSTPVVSVSKGRSIREVPHAVSIISRQQIEDQNILTLTEALAYTPGVTSVRAGSAAGSSLGNDSNFYSRGFAVANIQIDGGAAMNAVQNGYGSLSQLDMLQYDHVEFLRGVDGLYFSTGDPGGTINLVRKRAKAKMEANAAFFAGSWNNYRIEGDVTGPVTADGKVRARFGGAYQDRDYFYDIAHTEAMMVYGSIEGDISPDTLLIVGGNYQYSSGPTMYAGLPRYSNGEDLKLPRSTALIPEWATSTEKTVQAYARLEQKLGSSWQITLDALYSDQSRDANSVMTFGAVDPVTKTGGYWYGYPAVTGMHRLVLNANLRGEFDLLGRSHDLMIGGDYERGNGKTDMQHYSKINGSSVNVFNLVRPENTGSIYGKSDYHKMERYAGYGMLRLSMAERLKLIVGGRVSWYTYMNESFEANQDGTFQPSTGVRKKKDNAVFTPYAGLTYDIGSNWTAFASYAETYRPQNYQLKGPKPGTPIDAVTSTSYEIGLKGALMDNRLNAMVSLYRVDRKGEAVQDTGYTPTYGTYFCCFVNGGTVRSQGFDVEVSGSITDSWNITGGYTYNDNSDQQNGGIRYSSITPKHLFKLWSVYRLSGALSRLSMGAGVTAQSRHFVRGTARTLDATTGEWTGPSVAYEFSQKGYILANARLDYRITDGLSAAVNVNNIFDKIYYQTVGTSNNGNFYGEPRNFMVTLRAKY